MARRCGNCGEAGHYKSTCTQASTGLAPVQSVGERVESGGNEDSSIKPVDAKSREVKHVFPNLHGAWAMIFHSKDERCEHCK